jgi:hypothetical protein
MLESGYSRWKQAHINNETDNQDEKKFPSDIPVRVSG